MSDDQSSSVIVAVMDGSAWVPMADYEDARREMLAFRRCMSAIAKAFEVLEREFENEGKEHSGPIPDAPAWAEPTQPAPLGD